MSGQNLDFGTFRNRQNGKTDLYYVTVSEIYRPWSSLICSIFIRGIEHPIAFNCTLNNGFDTTPLDE